MKKYLNILILIVLVIAFSSCKKDNRGLVVGKIQKASKLSTTEFTIEKIVHGTKTKKLAWFINLNEARFLAYSKAIVKAGIDLQKLTPEDVKIEGKTIYLKLPAVEIINFSYPPENFSVDEFITDDAFLNKISIYDQEEFFRQAEIDIRNNLKYMDIEKTTENKTRVMIEGMLRALGYENIYISFKEEKDRSLIPEIPILNS